MNTRGRMQVSPPANKKWIVVVPNATVVYDPRVDQVGRIPIEAWMELEIVVGSAFVVKSIVVKKIQILFFIKIEVFLFFFAARLSRA